VFLLATLTIPFPRIPPEIFRVGPIALRWYGVMYLIGYAVGIWLARRHRVPFWSVLDTLAICGAPGLFFGRIGNFINGELYGRPSNVPWAMVFPSDPLRVPRHPSQLYEAFCEGIVLFFALRALERIVLRQGLYRPGLLAGAFLVGYGVLRFFIEFTRQPDAQLGFVLGPFSMGQLLCVAMIIVGAVILRLRLRRT
jgi:phosphatidylglycerol---prolipoprotein diacylglyceryl transferase